MEPAAAAWWSSGTGLVYAGVALGLAHARRGLVREQVRDHLVIGWWGLAATAFLAAARAGSIGAGLDDFGLDAMLRLGIVLAFVLAAAALVAAGASFLPAANGAVKSGASARPPS